MIDPGLEPLTERHCPDCGRNEFWRGPSGALALNIECKACGSRFNIGITPTRDRTVIMAQRISYNGLWPDHGDWP
jgi:hypothetical protein